MPLAPMPISKRGLLSSAALSNPTYELNKEAYLDCTDSDSESYSEPDCCPDCAYVVVARGIADTRSNKTRSPALSSGHCRVQVRQ